MNDAEKKQKIGFLLLGALFLVWVLGWGTSRTEEEKPEEKTEKSAKEKRKEEEEKSFVGKEHAFFKDHSKSSVKKGIHSLQSQDNTYYFTEQGATLHKVVSRHYKNGEKEQGPLTLGYPESNLGWEFAKEGEKIKTSDLTFTVIKTNDAIIFYYNEGQSDAIRITWRIKGNLLQYNLNPGKAWEKTIFHWYNAPYSQETHSYTAEKTTYLQIGNSKGKWKSFTGIHWYEGRKKEKTEQGKEEVDIRAFSAHNRFFMESLIFANEPRRIRAGISNLQELDTKAMKNMAITATWSPEEIQSNNHLFDLYFGPSTAEILAKVDEVYPALNFSQQCYVGWSVFGTINKRIFIPLFRTINEAMNENIGASILLFVLLLILLVSFFDYKAHKTKIVLKAAKPFLDKIKKKDPAVAKMEESAFYKKVGINPLSSLIPMAFQLVIMICMFAFMKYSMLFRQKSFLWIEDLSSYDYLINFKTDIPLLGNHISLLGLISLFLSIAKGFFKKDTKSAVELIPGNDNNAEEIKRKVGKALKYIGPFFFFFILNYRIAALTLFFLSREVCSIIQGLIFGHITNEKAIEKHVASKAELIDLESSSQTQSRFERRMLGKK